MQDLYKNLKEHNGIFCDIFECRVHLAEYRGYRLISRLS
jgi:hypothetical protein